MVTIVYVSVLNLFFFFSKQKPDSESWSGLVGSEMCLRTRDRLGNKFNDAIFKIKLYMEISSINLKTLFNYSPGSYTHFKLPTDLSWVILVGPGSLKKKKPIRHCDSVTQ